MITKMEQLIEEILLYPSLRTGDMRRLPDAGEDNRVVRCYEIGVLVLRGDFEETLFQWDCWYVI